MNLTKMLVLLDDDDEEADDDILHLLLSECQERIYRVYKFNFNGYSDDECQRLFRFTKREVVILFSKFKLPAQITTTEGTSSIGIDALCVFLRKMSYPTRYHDLENLFGRSVSSLCNIFYYVLEYLFNKYERKLYLDIKFLRSRVQLYSNIIARKGCWSTHIWGFIDGTVRPICVPSPGQRAVLNGHKRKHALKYQIISTPDGMIAHVWGGLEGRRHDRTLLNYSNLETALQNAQCFEGYGIYGDPAYGCTQYFVSPFPTIPYNELKATFNANMSKYRVCVEWSFADILRYWQSLEMRYSQRVFMTPVKKMYIVAVLLTNCVTCFNGNVTSNFFDIKPPSIDEYID